VVSSAPPETSKWEAVKKLLETKEFPLSRLAVLAVAGGERIVLGSESSVSVSDILSQSDRAQFRSASEVIEELDRLQVDFGKAA
jgi:hypothetical protein